MVSKQPVLNADVWHVYHREVNRNVVHSFYIMAHGHLCRVNAFIFSFHGDNTSLW